MNPSPILDPVAGATPRRDAVSPVAQTDRIETLDILPGVALLGILLMNIPGFGLGDNFINDFQSDPTNVNFGVGAVITILFEGKMRALFSMIFGVGIILFMARKERPGQSATGLFFGRMGWLVLFGLIDSHVLLWFGDILYFYGIIGMVAFLFRNMKPMYLALGVPLVAALSFSLITLTFHQNVRNKRLAYLTVQTAQQQGKPLTATQQQAVTDWQKTQKQFFPNPAEAAEHTRLMKSPNYLRWPAATAKRRWTFRPNTCWPTCPIRWP